MLSSRNGLRQRAGSQHRGQLLQTSEEHPHPWASVVASSGGTTGSSRQARLIPGCACLYVTGPLTLLGLLLSAEGALREPYENDGPTVAADMEAARETEAKLRAAAVPPAAVFSRGVSLLPSLPPSPLLFFPGGKEREEKSGSADLSQWQAARLASCHRFVQHQVTHPLSAIHSLHAPLDFSWPSSLAVR